MDAIEKLAALFKRFPGVGPRQAERFVHFLLGASPAMRREFAESVRGLTALVHQCSSCFRFYSGERGTCSICRDSNRSHELIVVATDADLSALERSQTYHGQYFVLGGTIHLASEKTDKLRLKEMRERIIEQKNRYKAFSEIILAFPANPEGDATETIVREELAELAKSHFLKITSLGRGLSTGSELEYADPETIKNALAGRK